MGGEALSDTYVLDTTSWTWKQVEAMVPYPLPVPRFGHSLVVKDPSTRQVLLFGGCDGVSQMFDEIYTAFLPDVSD